MTTQAGDWSVESTSTTGTSDIVLEGANPGYTRFRDTLVAGEVYYTVHDGNNREAGLGTFNGTNLLERTTVQHTLIDEVYDGSSPTPISLSGNAIVFSALTSDAFENKEDNLGNPSTSGQVLASTTGGVRSWTSPTGISIDHTLATGIEAVNSHPMGAITDLDALNNAATAHIADITTNPHQVTAGLIGLDQVDNTSDVNKPLSIADAVKLDHTNGVTTGIFETINAVPALEIDVSLGNVATKSITADSVFTFTGFTSAASTTLLELTSDGLYTVTFTGVTFGGDAPVIGSGLNVLIFTSTDTGSTINGFVIQDGS